MGLWDQIKPQFLGYSKAAAAVKDGHIDGMWVVSGFPTKAVIELAATKKTTLIDLSQLATKKGFYKEYPFYKSIAIQGNTMKESKINTKLLLTHFGWLAVNQ